MASSEIDPKTLTNIKHSLSITPKAELQARVGDKLAKPVFYKPV
jgi:hypothetical protein